MSAVSSSPQTQSSVSVQPQPQAPVVEARSGGSSGNAAAIADAGIVSAPATSAVGDAVGILGDAAALLLDALPLAAAVPLALARREQPWAAAWLGALRLPSLREAGDRVLAMAMDVVWPVGHAIEVSGEGNGSLGLSLGAGGSARLERGAKGWVGTLRQMGVVSGTTGEMISITMARGEPLIVHGMEAALGVAARVTRSFGGDLEAGTDDLHLRDVLLDRSQLVHSVVGVLDLVSSLLTFRPDSARVELLGTGGGNAASGGEMGPWARGDSSVSSGAAAGWEGDTGYVEAIVAGGGTLSGGGALVRWIQAMVGAEERTITLPAGLSVSVRAEGDLSRVSGGDFSDARFVCTASGTWGATQVSDRFTTESPPVVGRWLLQLASGAADIPGALAAGPIEADAVPDITFTRSITRRLYAPDDTTLTTLSSFAARAMPDHGPLVGVQDLALNGTIAVGRAAVLAALRGRLPPERESPEEAFLDVARCLASAASGSPSAAARTLDLEAGLAAIDIRDPALVASATFAMGAGIGFEMLLKAGGSVAGQSVVEVRHPLEEPPDATLARFMAPL